MTIITIDVAFLFTKNFVSSVHVSLNMDDSFSRSASMRMSSRAKAMSSLMKGSSAAVARQELLRSTWTGSSEDVAQDKTPPGSGNSSPARRRVSENDKL